MVGDRGHGWEKIWGTWPEYGWRWREVVRGWIGDGRDMDGDFWEMEGRMRVI